MRKLIIALFAMLLITVLILPLAMGIIVRNEVIKRLALYNQGSPQIGLVSYDLGWFRSKIIATIEMPTPNTLRNLPLVSNNMPKNLSFVTIIRLYHGPIALINTLDHHHKLVLTQAALSGYIWLKSDEDFLVMTEEGFALPTRLFARITPFGQWQIELEHPPIKYMDLRKNLIFNTGSILATMKLNSIKTGSPFDANIRVQSIQAGYNNTGIYFGPLTASINDYSSSRNNIKKNYRIHLSKVLLMENNELIADLKNLNTVASYHRKNDRTTLVQKTEINYLNMLAYAFQKVSLQSISKNAETTETSTNSKNASFSWKYAAHFAGREGQLTNLTAETPIGIIKAQGNWNIEPKTDLLKADVTLNLPAPPQISSLLAGMISGPGPVMPPGTQGFQNNETNMMSILINSAYQKGLLTEKGQRFIGELTYENNRWQTKQNR